MNLNHRLCSNLLSVWGCSAFPLFGVIFVAVTASLSQMAACLLLSWWRSRRRDWYRDTGKTCLGGGMNCPSASSCITTGLLFHNILGCKFVIVIVKYPTTSECVDLQDAICVWVVAAQFQLDFLRLTDSIFNKRLPTTNELRTVKNIDEKTGLTVNNIMPYICFVRTVYPSVYVGQNWNNLQKKVNKLTAVKACRKTKKLSIWLFANLSAISTLLRRITF